MDNPNLRFTYIGGPTALIEMGGLRFLTDPTFDPSGKEYRTDLYMLHKTGAPAVDASRIGYIDAVLLSHDHHFDNLDDAGREMIQSAGQVLTTPAAAKRLGNGVLGLIPWQTVEIPTKNNRILQITATPAQHGPSHADRGPVTGFVLAFADAPEWAVYISGDTVWFEGLMEIAKRFSVKTAILFMGAAKVAQVGPWHLTLTADEGVKVAQIFADAHVIPLHFEGWAHYSESKDDIERTFADAGLKHRLRWMEPGCSIDIWVKNQ